VAASVDIRRRSHGKTFTVHIQNPLVDPKNFDVVVSPAHDKLKGDNVFVTQGAIHHVTKEKLQHAAVHFSPLLSSLPHPVISVLVGGKNKHQGFTPESVADFAAQLLCAAKTTGGAIAMTASRRTGAENEAILRRSIAGVPHYIWDQTTENPYFGLLALADVIVVTGDSISMISEACSTGKPVYIYGMSGGRRHMELAESMVHGGFARWFKGDATPWPNAALDETSKAAQFVYERLCRKIGREPICRH